MLTASLRLTQSRNGLVPEEELGPVTTGAQRQSEQCLPSVLTSRYLSLTEVFCLLAAISPRSGYRNRLILRWLCLTWLAMDPSAFEWIGTLDLHRRLWLSKSTWRNIWGRIRLFCPLSRVRYGYIVFVVWWGMLTWYDFNCKIGNVV